MNLSTERIRAHNDELPRDLPNGHAVMTAGVAAPGLTRSSGSSKPSRSTTISARPTTPMANTTSARSKPTATRFFFKIDYLDKALAAHSPDPSDPSVTERVIAIMLAEELIVGATGWWPKMLRALTTAELRATPTGLRCVFA